MRKIDLHDKTMDKFFKVEELDHTPMPETTRQKFWIIWGILDYDWDSGVYHQ